MLRNASRSVMTALTHPEHGWKTTHFWGPVANWGIVAAAVSDAVSKSPDMISMQMTCTMAAYSAIFMRFAWMVKPRNYLLFSCHVFNVAAQSYQLARGYKHQLKRDADAAVAVAALDAEALAHAPSPAAAAAIKSAAAARGPVTAPPAPGDIRFNPVYAALAAAGTLGIAAAGTPIQRALTSSASVPAPIKAVALSPVGPFSGHAWAPLFKWALSISNILDFKRPVDKVSTAQQVALASTGFIWARYSLVITPKNWSLFLVNAALGATGLVQIARKLSATESPASPPASVTAAAAAAGAPAPVKAL